VAERRLLPHITLGLIRGILGICLDYEIALLAAVMEPLLLRILARLGLDFAPLGPLVRYHGLRQPCAADIADLIHGARERRGVLWQIVEADVAAIAPTAPPDAFGLWHAGWR
jgi:N-acyl amino acid synthase of PEP-CTERM/exosortase system